MYSYHMLLRVTFPGEQWEQKAAELGCLLLLHFPSSLLSGNFMQGFRAAT